MNALVEYISDNDLDPVETMNILEECGIVSSNAVFPGDVSNADALRAVQFMMVREKE